MTPEEALLLISCSIRRHPLRSGLTVIGIVIGIASVVLLGSIGEGTRRGIAAQFSQFGTTLVGITPGKSETFGVAAMVGSTRKLTLDDALALRRVPGVREMTCTINGSARV